MNLTKIEIVGDLAHFKIPNMSKYQLTYKIPPISTVVGILQSLYGTDINNFILGYTFNNEGTVIDLSTIYKEINTNSNQANKRFTKDIIYIENIINPKLIIYTDIKSDFELKNPLVLGKANYLARINNISNAKLITHDGQGYNQYTDIDTGKGMIVRINTETKYNENRDCYDYKNILVRDNRNFDYDKFYDEEENQNIFLWRWENGKTTKIR